MRPWGVCLTLPPVVRPTCPDIRCRGACAAGTLGLGMTRRTRANQRFAVPTEALAGRQFLLAHELKKAYKCSRI